MEEDGVQGSYAENFDTFRKLRDSRRCGTAEHVTSLLFSKVSKINSVKNGYGLLRVRNKRKREIAVSGSETRPKLSTMRGKTYGHSTVDTSTQGHVTSVLRPIEFYGKKGVRSGMPEAEVQCVHHDDPCQRFLISYHRRLRIRRLFRPIGEREGSLRMRVH